MKKLSDKILIWLFVGFIGVLFCLFLFLPDREFSEQENRYLQTAPRFSFSSLFSGDFTSDFESYTTDQFAFRDTWTSLKARSELAVGKKENNGVWMCKDMLIEGFVSPSDAELSRRQTALDMLVENSEVPVYLALIPDKSELYADELPSGAPNGSESGIISRIYSDTSAQTVDVLGVLRAHRDEYIFYNTDHHWSTLGAYYGYTAIADAMGFEANDISHYEQVTVSDSFYGTTYSSSGFSWVSPDKMQIFADASGAEVVNYPTGSAVSGVVYDYTRLESKDKYAMFFGGNTPRLVISTGASDELPSLLIVRDSYADCLTPFLFDHFSQIHVLDLRYYLSSLSAYIGENGIDQVLVMYSVPNFCSDTNVPLLAR